MTEAALLAMLPAFAFHGMLVFARLGAAVMLLPGLGEAEIPARIRLGLGLGLVVLLLPVLQPTLPAPADSVPESARLLVLEAAVGLWLGGLARLVAAALSGAGQVAALMLGLASVLQPDATFGGQQAVTARLFGLAGTVLVLSTGLYALPLRALAESYAVLPVGDPWPAGAAAEALSQAVADSLALALRLAAPFVLGSVVLQGALGMMARVAPQLQIYFLAVPGQILGGLLLLGLLLPPLLGDWSDAARAAFSLLPGQR
ncbi:flagellar biosynthetic protein FliR [Roseomonas sp. NAR14]|uniref:Flagellar biosynthetic protein FliR n=1 Tax=Roseomonas acroporae TaxID=2937791 RepID=A0A9X1Y498_9PROT|nr:flagellar biosynthetic protein FliR [Roseomonas acroporae]MCK8782770.1 flagellar biosynthetic protein FliR [Roseomonas acroporae]